MKNICLFASLMFLTTFSFAQSKLCYAYAYNVKQKILYVSKPLPYDSNLSATVNSQKDIKERFLKALKIKEGSQASNYEIFVETNPANKSVYGTATSKAEVDDAILNLKVEFSEKDYSIYTIDIR